MAGTVAHVLHRLLGYLRRLVHPGHGEQTLLHRSDASVFSAGFPDVDWSMCTRNTVLDDARRAADAVVRSCPLGQVLSATYLGFDRERGSLQLRLACTRHGGPSAVSLVLAVDDPVTAEHLEAACSLGGLHFVLARAGYGRLLVEGLWEGRRYHIYGIPAVRPLLDASGGAR